jgi:NAD-dependent DNA ligase
MAATADELHSVQGIGPQIAVSVVRFFTDKHNRRIIERLEKAGVQMAKEDAPDRLTTVCGQNIRIDRYVKLDDARRSQATDSIAWRKGCFERFKEDGLRRCRRRTRLEAGKSAGT